ncbi:MAG: arylsulfatase [FCB group bacterium]|nr:arylsulfatase [FCB group bacterium]
MEAISRREWMRRAGLAAGAVALGGLASAQDAPAVKPNIIFILADDLGYGDLGCFGQKSIGTPNLDAMASEGVRFTQCYSGSTVCAPSRCSLMTGLHMGHAWIRGNANVPLRPEDTTVAEVLKGAGYSTALIGKWGLGEPDTTGIPNRKGFDYFYGYLNQGHAHNYYPTYLWRNEEKVTIEGNVESEHEGVSKERAQYSHDLFTKEALGWLEGRKKEEPFFLYLAYTVPHANNERGAVEGDGMEVPEYGEYAEREWPTPLKGRAAMVARLDRDVGKVLQKLRDLGLDENTLVIFSSDNGPHREGESNPEFFDSNGPLRGIKRDLYEGGIRVPTIARWPGRIAPGRVSEQAWAFWDFLPTAAALADAPAPSGLDGISMAPTLLGEGKQPQHEYLYWEFHEGRFHQAIRIENWKGVRTGERGPIELYDLSTDLSETRGLAARHPEVVARMEACFAKARTDNPHWPVVKNKALY